MNVFTDLLALAVPSIQNFSNENAETQKGYKVDNRVDQFEEDYLDDITGN